MALQRQLNLVTFEKEADRDTTDISLAMAGDARPSGQQLRRRTVTSHGSAKSVDDEAAAAEKKALVPNQLVKEEDVEEGTVRYISAEVHLSVCVWNVE